MVRRKFSKFIVTKMQKVVSVIVSLMVIASALLGPSLTAQAMPVNPTDETKVPHYFGPNPNWANSPFTLADVAVQIIGDGTGAAATATVGANGAVTDITLTNPGSNYTTATVNIVLASDGVTNKGATADASITLSPAVTSATVTVPGAGYTNPTVTFSGGGATVDATGVVFGGVDNIILTSGGSGYSNPTVDFDLPDDPNGVQAQGHPTWDPTTGEILSVVVDVPGSGYSTAPVAKIYDGTQFDPINGGTGATATTTLALQSVGLISFGSGYTSAPTVTFGDTVSTPSVVAEGTATIDAGAITAINLTAGGSGYITTGGIKKFQDGLPQLCIPAAGQTFDSCLDNNLGQHIPVAIADKLTFPGNLAATPPVPAADYYVIGLVQHREKMSSSLPTKGTLLRQYVQLLTPNTAAYAKNAGAGVPLFNDMPNGTSVPAAMPDGTQAIALDDPHFLGPVIVASKDRPVRIVFYNLLPKGQDGNLFLPVDTTMMGSGMGPMDMGAPMADGTVMDEARNPACTDNPQAVDGMGMPLCFTNNRATLHLHGGNTPWISDGTPHQWITPADEMTPWPQGVTVAEVPDMKAVPGVPDCSLASDGCQTFYYTNQQSARLLFYHDHSWGITRLNVYAGEAAGYVITDPTEQKLFGPGGTYSDMGEGIPLVIQDRTFVPQDSQLYNTYDANNKVLTYGQDPTWDATRWGNYGDLWYHHVYMPAQNPGDPSGMSAYGRWMYGPWFWPPAKTAVYGPIPNPYYNMDPATNFTTPLAVPCNLDDPATWQYQTDPFCEPELIPGTPNVSVGMEQFNDTPLVNGTAYPTTELLPKAYRLRLLNAANDRFWNLQWYVADPRTGTDSEVALNPAELAAAQTDPNVFPTPDTVNSPVGPSWIQIGTEGGFLPAPTVVGNQPITWITDPTRFDVGNVDKHAMLLAPAERADVIVDFSKFAGKTLILYNDAPAAFPARVASYDYYTGAPDLSPAGAPTILPGYGPNTRTIMQVKIANVAAAPAFDLLKLQNAFKHKADGSGVFEASQNPIIVGQAAYNSAYGTTFAASGFCSSPTSANKCDGMARIQQQGGDLFTFDTLLGSKYATWKKLSIPLQPKAIHDEMNAASFDEYGRMTANLGLEAVPATPAGQNIILYPYVNPGTEFIDGTNLPKADVKVSAISSASDGTQIWKITHNGVDTHPIHFHLYDVQILNRVTWDNIIIPTEPSELGWKDTIRVSPLEDTIVALRPIVPVVPFELPNSIHTMNPMMPVGSTAMFNNIDASGNPTNPVINQLVNFGWEYVYHCHILSHEEMDMMRPVSLVLPPNKPDQLSYSVSKSGLTLNWMDNSINETSFIVQRRTGTGTTGAWTNVYTVNSPLDQTNQHQQRSWTDTSYKSNTIYQYQVIAQNTAGYGGQFMSMTAKSVSGILVTTTAPAAPTNLTAVVQTGPKVSLTFRDNATNEAGFVLERADNGGSFVGIANLPARNSTGNVTYVDSTVAVGSAYQYRVVAVNIVGPSAYSNTVSVNLTIPAAPSNVTAVSTITGTSSRSITVSWTNNATAVTSFQVQRATNSTFTSGLSTTTVAPNLTSLTQTGFGRNATYYYRVIAVNNIFTSAPVNATPFPVVTQP